jgi:hypothetical protein
MEANERLVGSLVFKTSDGLKSLWRVRFPSASAIPACDLAIEKPRKPRDCLQVTLPSDEFG